MLEVPEGTALTVTVAAILLTSACCHLWLLLLLQDILWWALYKAEALLLGSRLRKAALTEVGSMCRRRLFVLGDGMQLRLQMACSCRKSHWAQPHGAADPAMRHACKAHAVHVHVHALPR